MTWSKRWTCTVRWRSLRTARTKIDWSRERDRYVKSLHAASSTHVTSPGNEPSVQQQFGRRHGCVASGPQQQRVSACFQDQQSCFPGYVHQEVIVEHVAGDPERPSRLRLLPSRSRLGSRCCQEVRHRFLRSLPDENPESGFHPQGALSLPALHISAQRLRSGPEQAGHAWLRAQRPQPPLGRLSALLGCPLAAVRLRSIRLWCCHISGQ